VLGVVDTIDEVTLIDCLQGAARGTSPITIALNQSIGAARRVGGGPNSTDYEATPTWDGTNAPLVITGITPPP